MLSLKPRQLTEENIVEKLKIVIEACDANDYKTKKFVGLLHDYIPYQSGLKVRLELMGKQGLIEQLEKLKKESNQSVKIDKMASQFAKEYGFVHEECSKSFSLLARAMSLNPIMTQNSTLKIVSSIQGAQGNFSKKHLQTEEKPSGITLIEKPRTQESSNPKIKTKGDSKAQNYKKKFVRNKFNLFAYLFFIVALPIAYYALNTYYGDISVLVATLENNLSLPIINDPWFTAVLIATGAATLLPVVTHWAFKLNVVSVYPLLILLAEVVLGSIQPKFPEFNMMFQLAIGIGMVFSFGMLAFYAMRLPKGAKEYLSYKTLVPYYLSAAIWLLSQMIIFTR